MMPEVGAAFLCASGVALVYLAWVSHRVSLAQRVRQGGVSTTESVSTFRSYVADVWLRFIEGLGSTTASVNRRLELLGGQTSLAHFRLTQLVAAIGAMATVGVGVVFLLRNRSVASVLAVVLVLVIAALFGVSGWDQLLTFRAKRRQRIIDQQVPDTADLLALSVSAGESIPDALSRVCRISHGELSVELQRTVTDIRLGLPTIQALMELSRRNDAPSLERLCQTLVTAIERGTPLAGVLHDQAKDIRDTTRQKLLEEGGKREIVMLVPVVFLILPITVLFALYPGLSVLNVTP